MERMHELNWMIQFVKENGELVSSILGCEQLRSLWTSYCLRYNIDADTMAFNKGLADIWVNIAHPEWSAVWTDYVGYKAFMSENLV